MIDTKIVLESEDSRVACGNRRLNVLTVTGFVLDDQASGINTMINTLTKSLAGVCRNVFLENDWNTPRLSRRQRDGDVHYVLRLRSPYIAGKHVRGFLGWCLSFPAMMRDLRRLVRDESIDIIHLHYAAPYQYCFRLARMLWGIPYILTLHRGDVMSFPKWRDIDTALDRFVVTGANSVVAVSQWLADQAISSLGKIPKLDVIHNGLDFEALDALYDRDLESRLEFELPDRFFLIVSNVAQYKGQDVAIRAWSRVITQWPNVPLLIVGDKRELWGECVRLIDELGCGDAVKLLGAQPRATAVSLMRRATAVIMPSRSEGLPYALLEAGALGKPIICSDIGPFTEVLMDGVTALITPVEDHDAIAEASIRLLNDSSVGLALGENLATKIRGEFSSEEMAKKYLAIYLELVAQTQPAHVSDQSL